MSPLLQWRAMQTGGRLSSTLAALFFLVPLFALVTRITPAQVIEGLATPEARSALAVSVGAVAVALAFVVLFGTPAAYAMARRDTRATRAMEVLFDLPLVLPPAVAGIALLAAFGNGGLLGGSVSATGLDVAFTRAAVVIALAFVAGPLYIRYAQAAFAAVDRSTIDAARTSGAGALTNLLRIDIPLARPGLLTGAALCSARALGEFGATIMFAGSVAGATQTVTLAIYGSLETKLATSFALATMLLVLTVAMSVAARALSARSGTAA